MGTVSYYVMLLYIPIYAVRQLGLPMSGAQLSSVLSTALIVVFCPFAGSLSDRIGRRVVLLPATIIYVIVVWAAVHYLLAAPSITGLILAQMATSLVMAFIWGPTPVVLMELFPVGIRSTGVGLIYNFAVAIFGGLAPFAITWLIAATGDKMSPVYYVAISAAVGLIGLLLLRERRNS
jgi:MFS family permease